MAARFVLPGLNRGIRHDATVAACGSPSILAGHCQSTFLLVNILPARRSLIFGTLQAIKGLMTKGILREYYAKCKFSPLMVVLC